MPREDSGMDTNTSIIQANRHLRDMTPEERMHFLTEVMAQNAADGVRMLRRLEEIADRFEGLLKSMGVVPR